MASQTSPAQRLTPLEPSTARAAISVGAGGHEEESRAYLQRRLQLVVLVSALAVSLFYVVSFAFELFTGTWTTLSTFLSSGVPNFPSGPE